MILYNTKEQAKEALRKIDLPFGASIILETKEGKILGVQDKKEIKFLDLDSLPPLDGKANQILKIDESGNLVWADDEVRTIVDNVTSTDTDKALSANMGKYLNDSKLDNELLDKKNLANKIAILQSDTKTYIDTTYITYNKSNNSFKETRQSIEIPLANTNNNGLISPIQFKLLDSIINNATNDSKGIITELEPFTYTNTTALLNNKILVKNGLSWKIESANCPINAATTTTAGVMTAEDKLKLDNTVTSDIAATPDTLGLVKQAADLTDLGADADLAGVIAQFNQLLENLKEAGIMYRTNG